METPPESITPARTRRAGRKSKTGCITCKMRHVKCGEEKPSCHRCKNAGITCDGYVGRPHQGKKPIRAHNILMPKITMPPLCGALEKSPFASAEEYRYFALFRERTAFDILPAYDTGSTRDRLLQSCYSNPSIRHAIVAIGGLDKTSQTVWDFGKLSLGGSSQSPQAAEHYQTALQQYTNAVAHMRVAASHKQMDPRTTLLTCLLIICFESWTGNLKTAVLQAQIGIRIIQEWRAKYERPYELHKRLSPAPDVVEDDLIQIFCRLALQIHYFVDANDHETYRILSVEGDGLIRTMPDSFSTLQEASKYHQGLLRQGATLISTIESGKWREDPEATKHILDRKEEIELSVGRWMKAFEQLSKTLKAGGETQYGKWIKISMTCGHLAMVTCLSKDETIHDNYIAEHREIVDVIEEVLTGLAQASQSRSVHFSLDTRMILPLWLTGTKCRDKTVRRKAIRLLLQFPWREGIWDSIFAGKILQWITEVEEEFCEADFVPGWARVPRVSWNGDLEQRTALLICHQRMSSSSKELSERRKIISW